MINKVTITGADDSVKPEDLLRITDKYPFVEWGILVSRTSSGTPRFPSLRWIDKLLELNNQRILNNQKSLDLSLHLCGAYVRELLNAKGDFIENELDDIWNAFARVQINTHAVTHTLNSNFTKILNEYPDKEFIFQYDNVNTYAIKMAMDAQVKLSALFDLSHGAGILPKEWPKPIEGVKIGYAGGLSTENIDEESNKISLLSGPKDVWIDTETHVRSGSDSIFDISKVEDCLQKAGKYIQSWKK